MLLIHGDCWKLGSGHGLGLGLESHMNRLQLAASTMLQRAGGRSVQLSPAIYVLGSQPGMHAVAYDRLAVSRQCHGANRAAAAAQQWACIALAAANVATDGAAAAAVPAPASGAAVASGLVPPNQPHCRISTHLCTCATCTQHGERD